jgi:hypothetical protein
VQSVIKADREEKHEARHAEHKQQMEERLTQAVKDGKITEEQKSKILAKHQEIADKREAERDAMKDKTREERKAAMDANREELKKWASDNGIDEKYLMGFGRGHHGGMGKPER